MPLFGEVVGPNFPKYCQILLKFSPQYSRKQKQYFKNFWKTHFFTETRDTQSLHFWFNFGPSFAPEEDGQIKKKTIIILEEKIHPLGYPKIVKSRRVSSPLQMKNRITFYTF